MRQPWKCNKGSTLLSCLATLFAFALGGCATAPGRTTSDDPWAGMNRGVYKFNDGLDRAVLKPTAKGYVKITPNWLRAGAGRFFDNLGYPVTIVNQLLQGKPKLFLQDAGRFLANSTLGLVGIFDVADHMHMPSHSEDFGQTLAVWGVPSGPYVMLPLLGPSTLRDAPGRIPDYFLGVFRYVDVDTPIQLGVRAVDLINTRASLLSADGTLNNAYDKYGILRDAWLQRREYLVFDGNPPVEDIAVEDDPDEAQSKQ